MANFQEHIKRPFAGRLRQAGNPLVIEKAQVDAELLRLTRLSHSHAEEQYRLRSNLRYAQEDVKRYNEQLANLREDLLVRRDTSGDKFRIELDGQVLDNRGIAGELLVRQAGKIKKNFGASRQVGKFAGFNLFLRASYDDSVHLVLKGKNHYTANVTDTASGTIRSLESEIQGFEEFAKRLETNIHDSQKLVKELETKVGVPFEHEKRYHELAKRQAEIEEKLDLTKNQAPSQVEDGAHDEIEEKSSQGQIHTMVNKEARQAAVRV